MNYSGGALSTDGILYIGTQSNYKVLGLDITNGNIVFEETVGQQVMAAVTIGPDKRLYCGTSAGLTRLVRSKHLISIRLWRQTPGVFVVVIFKVQTVKSK